MNESGRALSFAWGIAFLGLVYSELNTPPTQNSFTAFLDALTIDGPAAGMGLLTGATVMHALRYAQDPVVAKQRIALVSAFLMLSGMILASIQVAIYPISFVLGAVALCALGFVYLTSLPLLILLTVTTLASSFVHTVFAIDAPVGGQYPIIAWLAYGMCGTLLYRSLDSKKISPQLLFILGIIIGFMGILTVIPNYLPDLFGIDPAVGKYYRDNPPTTAITFLSSTANSGGLLNVVGNFAAGGYTLAFGYLAQGISFLQPLRALGRMSYGIYPIYVILAAISMNGFPGISVELSTALDSSSTAAQHKTVDWPTFHSWVENSQSWDDLSEHEVRYYGPSSESIINESKKEDLQRNTFWFAYPLVIISSLIVSTLWVRRFHKDPL